MSETVYTYLDVMDILKKNEKRTSDELQIVNDWMETKKKVIARIEDSDIKQDNILKLFRSQLLRVQQFLQAEIYLHGKVRFVENKGGIL